MAYQKKDGDGALFNNGYKQKDSQPDMCGDLLLDGKDYEIAGWKKSTRNGETFFSLRVQPKRTDKAQHVGESQHPPVDHSKDFDDEIPF